MRLLGRNLSLVAGDFHLATSLSRDLRPKLGPARPESTQMGPARPESTQVGPARPEFDPAVPGPSRRRSFDSPQCPSDHSSRQGSHNPPPPIVSELPTTGRSTGRRG